jgi:uncharacterized protein involved in exopolysaccharide biosynthesis
MDATASPLVHDDQIRLKELLQRFWRAKWLAFAFIAALGSIGAGAALVSPKMYKASVIVSPESNSPGGLGQGGGLGSVVSQFGGLASLAGLSLGADAKKAESVAVLQSEALTEKFIERNDLLPVLYAKAWDSRLKRWKATDPSKTPTLWKAGQRFKGRIRSISTDPKTGLVTMTITWTDPHVAAAWANQVVKMANDFLRDKAITETRRNIDYLNEQASKTDAVGVKAAIYQIMQTEISREMLARGSDEYALKVIDPAMAPEEQSSPQIVLWTLLGLFTGVVLSLVGVFVRMSWERG